ncbi:MAG TPA: response regulator [Gemmatimonadales bacterium]|jgi:two-component system chemotaxis response regulator CheY|nr:response regulator [Gemmatimonadales bacterium]
MSEELLFLVVDDSRLHHQMYDIIFSKPPFQGARVLHAANGREGYALFATHPELTMVFLDLNMPEMNGLEFLARRRAEQLHPHVPVVLVTTESTPADEARGRDAGAWEYLRKPFTPEDIQRLVARARPAPRA